MTRHYLGMKSSGDQHNDLYLGVAIVLPADLWKLS